VSAESSNNISRELFSKACSGLTQWIKLRSILILSQPRIWLMLAWLEERQKCWHKLKLEKPDKSILKGKYQLKNSENARIADMKEPKPPGLVLLSHVWHPAFYWISGNGRRRRIASAGWKKKSINDTLKRKDMRESKLSHIGIAPSSGTAGMQVWNCLL
jgi:UDP-2,3-diacylglucosamine pyrophosphatase LpxH